MAEKKTTNKTTAKKRSTAKPRMTEAQKAAKKALEEEEIP